MMHRTHMHVSVPALKAGVGVAALQERGVLQRPGPTPGGEDWLANPALPEDILREAVRTNPLPGC